MRKLVETERGGFKQLFLADLGVGGLRYRTQERESYARSLHRRCATQAATQTARLAGVRYITAEETVFIIIWR